MSYQFLKKKHRAHACANTVFNGVEAILRSILSIVKNEKIQMKFSCLWENVGNSPFTWRHGSTRNDWCLKTFKFQFYFSSQYLYNGYMIFFKYLKHCGRNYSLSYIVFKLIEGINFVFRVDAAFANCQKMYKLCVLLFLLLFFALTSLWKSFIW